MTLCTVALSLPQPMGMSLDPNSVAKRPVMVLGLEMVALVTESTDIA